MNDPKNQKIHVLGQRKMFCECHVHPGDNGTGQRADVSCRSDMDRMARSLHSGKFRAEYKSDLWMLYRRGNSPNCRKLIFLYENEVGEKIP